MLESTAYTSPTLHVLLLAALYHESCRRPVAEGTTQYSDLPELAQQGRERQASFLLKRFTIEPRIASGVQFPSTWDLTAPRGRRRHG